MTQGPFPGATEDAVVDGLDIIGNARLGVVPRSESLRGPGVGSSNSRLKSWSSCPIRSASVMSARRTARSGQLLICTLGSIKGYLAKAALDGEAGR